MQLFAHALAKEKTVLIAENTLIFSTCPTPGNDLSWFLLKDRI